jgi:hypothetical protein
VGVHCLGGFVILEWCIERGRGRGGLVLGKRVVVEGKVFLFDFNWFVYGFWISLGGVFSGDSVGAGGGGGGDCVLIATGLGEEETVGFLFGKRVIVE